MKTNIAIILIVGILTYALTLYLSENNIQKNVIQAPDEGSIHKDITDDQKIPDFTFKDINGTTHSASDFKDKIIILNFWASWCAPCIKEFPNLLKATETFKDDVVLIALSSDLDQGAITKFMKKMQSQQNLNFDADNILIALDENQAITAGKFQTFKLPETILIDQNQNIRHKLIGADWNLEDLEEKIIALKQ